MIWVEIDVVALQFMDGSSLGMADVKAQRRQRESDNLNKFKRMPAGQSHMSEVRSSVDMAAKYRSERYVHATIL